MPALKTQGISLHYDTFGDRSKPPVMLITGLGGVGRSWGPQTQRFAAEHFVTVPDHRGTGQTTRAEDGYTIAQLALDMASLLEHLNVGPTHLVGSSTGGCIAQLMALDHAGAVRSVTIGSSCARVDAYLRREFAIRRRMAAEYDMKTLYNAYALFLFSPAFASRNADFVSNWIERATASPPTPADREISLKRIDMVMAHDAHARLGEIKQPTLVICGEYDFCVPAYLSREIAEAIPGAKLEIIPNAGHLVHDESEDAYFEIVNEFINRH